MAQYNIRWKRGDYISLGKAVSSFNKKIRELTNNENKLFLPEELDYTNVKSRIKTRQELNRYIKRSRSFLEQGQEEIIEINKGEYITKWEKRQLSKEYKTYEKRLAAELAKLNEPYPGAGGYSRAQMGHQIVREKQKELEKLKNFRKLSRWGFSRTKK